MLWERLAQSRLDRGFGYENLDPRHFYAAYIFDDPKDHQDDLDVLITEAKKLGRPVRYWWLSDVTNLGEAPDRLIIGVHHPTSGEGACLDLHNRLYEQKVSIDAVEATTFEEYVIYSRPVRHLGVIATPESEGLFPDYVPPHNEDQSDFPSMREMDSLVALTYGDLQSVALTALGRYLNEAEIAQTTAVLQDVFDHKVTQLVTRLEHLQGPVSTVAGATETDYLVYYSLGGLAMTRANSESAASESIFAALHSLIGRSAQTGVTPQEVSQMRLHELEIEIESVEAIEFATDKSLLVDFQ